jgi:SAM-dependent methyltransferase
MKNREDWQKNKYSKFWSNQVKKYGFDNYCKGLLNLILSYNPSRVYELAIGTGWPFAKTISDLGISVSGSDISSVLVSEIESTHPEIIAEVKSYQNIREDKLGRFDIVYCFRSTWYFPNILQAIDKMFLLVKPGGMVIFDILNSDSKYIKYLIIRHRLMFPITIFKNLLKVILHYFNNKNYFIHNIWWIDEIPVSSSTIENYLQNKCDFFCKYSVNQIETNLKEEFSLKWKNDHKIIFVCKCFVI